jgi:hypothetical protein
VADCGFFLAFPEKGAGQPAGLKNKTFGFQGNAGPFGLQEYVPVSQSPVTGAGTAASPYSQMTVFEAAAGGGEGGVIVTETTTYVNGAPQFTSTFAVKNMTTKTIYFRALYAGDLFVNGSDLGTGVFLGGPPRFIGGQNTKSGVFGGLVEVGAPALPWSHFQELAFPNVWTAVQKAAEEEEKTFNDTIEPAEVDNAAGVEWDQYQKTGLPKGEEATFSIINRTQVPSALQISPTNQTLTQGQTETVNVTALDTASQPYAGKTLRYTVGGANAQSGSVVLNSSGQAQISYVGNNAGIDTIQMFLDLAGSGTQTSNDPAGASTVTFLPKPPPTPNSSYKVQSIHANADGTITIVFVPTQAGQATLEVTVPTGTISRKQAEAAKRKKCKKGQIKLKGKCRPAVTRTGKVTAAGAANVPLSLTVKASSKVKAALKKGRTVKLTAKLTYQSSLGGAPSVTKYVFTVKPRKKHKKH